MRFELKTLGLSLLTLLASSAFAEPLKVQRLDDSYIEAYLSDTPKAQKSGILLVFQGSECFSIDPDGDRFPYELPKDIVRLDIQKYGITPESQRDKDGQCPATYLANNTIDGRVIDAFTVLSYLHEHADWWDGRLFVSGASEGATIAAIVGALSPDTRGIILINGSIGRPFREGWAEAVTNSVSQGGGSAKDIEDARKETLEVWDKARATPTTETYQGPSNTLRWWRSIIDLRPLNLLNNKSVPIVLLQSEFDQMTPVTSARIAAEALAKTHKNFQYIEIPGLNHGFRDKDNKPQYQMVLPKLNAALDKLDRLSKSK